VDTAECSVQNSEANRPSITATRYRREGEAHRPHGTFMYI
jgi:hypothetical protein